jgi:hypothetical protein
VTASSTCQSTPITSTPGTINWIAISGNSITQFVEKPTKDVGQPNEVQGTLMCGGSMALGVQVR